MIKKYLKDTATDKFIWGQNDCALWSAGLVHLCTGVDVANDLRGKYSDWFGCRRVLIENGGIETIARDRLSFLESGEKNNGVGLVRMGQSKIAGILFDGKFYAKRQNGKAGLICVSDFCLIEGWSCHKH